MIKNAFITESFYIDISKNIISYFSTLEMLFVILLPISSKKMKHPSFLIRFGKQIKDT